MITLISVQDEVVLVLRRVDADNPVRLRVPRPRLIRLSKQG